MTKEERKKIIVLSIIGLFLLGGLIYNSIRSEYLANGKTTVGKITDYHFCNNKYCGTYKYEVGGKTYEGHWSGSFFKCPDGTNGCVGKKFPVRYSVEKPNISEIDLGKFDGKKSYRPTIWN